MRRAYSVNRAPDRPRRLALWCVTALGLGALAACSSGTVTTGAPAPSVSLPASASAPVTAPSTPAETPSPAPTVKPSLPAPVGAKSPTPGVSGALTLTGTIYAGAEPSCLLLTQGSATYLLSATDAMKLRVGQRVVVSGNISPKGLMTHCMQGIPFKVTYADILSPNG